MNNTIDAFWQYCSKIVSDTITLVEIIFRPFDATMKRSVKRD